MAEPLQQPKPLGFWKTVLASFIGFIAANIVSSIFFLFFLIVLLVGSVISDSSTKVIREGSVLKIDISSISELVTTDELSSFFPSMKSEGQPVSLSQALASIRKAKADPRVRGIYLNLEGYDAGMASTADLREALKDFRSSGKFIISYADTYEQKAYYLSSVADKVILNPQGMVGLVGLASTPTFYHQALEKLGVKAHIFKVGTYKGAVEPYMLDKLSEPNREQISAYLTGLWDFMLRDISASRSIPVDSLRAFADSGRAFGDAETFVRAHLVDTLAYRLDVETLIAQRLGVESADDVPQVTLADLWIIRLAMKVSRAAWLVSSVNCEMTLRRRPLSFALILLEGVPSSRSRFGTKSMSYVSRTQSLSLWAMPPLRGAITLLRQLMRLSQAL